MALFDNKKKLEKIQTEIEAKAQNMLNSFVIDEATGTLKKYKGVFSEVYIPHSVVKIDTYAFKECKQVREVHMADSVKIIGYGAFMNCESLTKVEFSPNVEYIGTHAFMSCYELTSAVLPQALIAMGYGAFSFCTKLAKLSVAKGNKAFKESSNVIYSKDGKVMHLYAPAKKETDFKVPGSVKRITEEAFCGNRFVKKVVLPKGLARIESRTLAGCSSLNTVTIPKTVQEIKDGAFMFCSNVSEYILPYGLKNIGEEAFFSQRKKQYITYKGNKKQWDAILRGKNYVAPGTMILNYKPGFKSFLANLFKKKVKNSAATNKSITDYYCDNQVQDEFENFDVNLKGEVLKYNGEGYVVRLPRYASSIKSGAFDQKARDRINTLKIPASFNAKFLSLGDFANEYFCVEYLEGTTEIISSPNAKRYLSITLPDSVQKIGPLAFFEKEIKRIHLPKGLTDLSPTAFANCKYIENITVDPKNTKYTVINNCLVEKETGVLVMGCNNSVIPQEGITKIGHGAFWGRQNMHKIILPNTVTSIGPVAFSNSNVNNIFIPANTTEIDNTILQYCNDLESIEVDASNPKYLSKNNCLIEKDTKTLFVTAKNATIPDDGSVEKFEMASVNTAGTTLAIPASVKEIDKYSIVSKDLKAIYVDKDNENFVSIDGVLYRKNPLEVISVPDKLEGKITLPDGLTEISGFNKRPITEITVPASVTKLSGYIFSNCEKLVKVNLPDTITEIYNNVFEGCTSLKELHIPASVSVIGAFAFKDSGITDIYSDAPSRPATWTNNFEKYCNATVHFTGTASEAEEAPAEEEITAVEETVIPPLPEAPATDEAAVTEAESDSESTASLN